MYNIKQNELSYFIDIYIYIKCVYIKAYIVFPVAVRMKLKMNTEYYLILYIYIYICIYIYAIIYILSFSIYIYTVYSFKHIFSFQ